jgi:general stress protein 26
MTPAELVAVLRNYKLAVQASVAPTGAPQAAVVGFAVTDALKIIFDTAASSRKYRNLRDDPRVALVIGWEDETTVQIEGIADVPVGDELERLRACYFVAYPDGRERLAWPDITHFRVRPTWVRYSDFTQNPPRIVELSAEQLTQPTQDGGA